MYERELVTQQLRSQPIRVCSATPKTAGFLLTSDPCRQDSKTHLVDILSLSLKPIFFFKKKKPCGFRKIPQICFTTNFCFPMSPSKSAHKEE